MEGSFHRACSCGESGGTWPVAELAPCRAQEITSTMTGFFYLAAFERGTQAPWSCPPADFLPDLDTFRKKLPVESGNINLLARLPEKRTSHRLLAYDSPSQRWGLLVLVPVHRLSRSCHLQRCLRGTDGPGVDHILAKDRNHAPGSRTPQRLVVIRVPVRQGKITNDDIAVRSRPYLHSEHSHHEPASFLRCDCDWNRSRRL